MKEIKCPCGLRHHMDADDCLRTNCTECCPLQSTQAPAADVVEVVHGEWIMAMDDFDDGHGERMLPHCSNCSRGVYRHDAGMWCPFCGAKMDGGKNER